MSHKQMDKEMRECIDLCQECHRACEETMAHCLQKGGKHAEAEHIQFLQDCAQICQISADFMSRQSDLHGQICDVCVVACRVCAESCEQVDKSDMMMHKCIDICRRCAEACDKMVKAVAA